MLLYIIYCYGITFVFVKLVFATSSAPPANVAPDTVGPPADSKVIAFPAVPGVDAVTVIVPPTLNAATLTKLFISY